MELPKTTQELAEIVRRNYECGLECGRQRGRDEVVKEELEALRDKFAMAAMNGMYASGTELLSSAEEIAATSYLQADAMLVARNKRG